jgi:hypothetical protein
VASRWLAHHSARKGEKDWGTSAGVVGRIPLVLAALLLAAPVALADATAPQLHGIRMDQTFYPAGAEATAWLKAADETGIAEAALRMEGAGGFQLISGHCHLPESYTSWAVVEFGCSISIPQSTPEGDYSVSRVFLADSLEHGTEYHQGIHFTNGSDYSIIIRVGPPPPDETPPQLRGITIEPRDILPGGNVTVRIDAYDPAGLNPATLKFRGPNGTEVSFECVVTGNGIYAHRCTHTFSATAAPGNHTLSEVTLRDSSGNAKTYKRGTDYVESTTNHTSVRVTEPFVDKRGPQLRGYTAPAVPIERGGTYAIVVRGDDDDIVDWVMVLVGTSDGRAPQLLQDCAPIRNKTIAATCVGQVPEDAPLGRLYIKWLFLRDPAGHEQYFPVGSPPENAANREALLDAVSIRVLPRTLQANGTGAVWAFGAYELEREGGVYADFLVRATPDVTSVSFRFQNGSAQLGADDCPADYDVVRYGFRCRILVPRGQALGNYTLTSLQANVKGQLQEVAVEQNRTPWLLIVERSLGPVEGHTIDEQERYVVDGITQAAFYQEVQPPRTETTQNSTSQTTTPKRGGPGLPVVLMLGAILAVVLHRRRH